MNQSELYQSVLKKLSTTPVEQLPEVDRFLSQLNDEMQDKKNNKDKTLALAGSWANMNEKDFQEYLKKAKETGSETFSREVEL